MCTSYMKFETIFFKSNIYCLSLKQYFSGGQSRVTFNYENRCTESIWLGATPSIGDSDPEFPSETAKELRMPDQWKGFIWGRTKCSLNATNYFSCETGDCGGNKICQWPVPNSPVTILNFTINQPVQTNPLVVSYELNLNHGHNVPVRIQPVGGSQLVVVLDHALCWIVLKILAMCAHLT